MSINADQSLMIKDKSDHGEVILEFSGKGMTSRQNVAVRVCHGTHGQGIRFLIKPPKPKRDAVPSASATPEAVAGALVKVPARAEFVVNTLRNVTLGSGSVRLCIVEHFLAAASLWGLEDLDVIVDGPELPLGDGSANFWIDLWQNSTVATRTSRLSPVELPQPVVVSKGDRSIIALPDSKFSVTYLMDWSHPLIGKRWNSWEPAMAISEIADARTFGMLKEHQMLGLTDDVVSLTEDGFTHPLRFADEPVRHKLLDLIGDLSLIGINPLRLKARFISIKGGHELDVQLAGKIQALLAV